MNDKAEPHQQHLDERDPDHAQRNRTDGGGAQRGNFRPLGRAADARGNLHRAAIAALAIGHENTGDDQGEDEHQETHADAGQFAQQGQAEVLICGRYFAVRSGRSVAACSHKPYSGLPTNGQLAMDSAGGGK